MPSSLVRVLAVRPLGQRAYVLRLERGNLQFRPGQYIRVGLPALRAQREYTVYSSPSDGYLEVLIREIPSGLVSPRLRRCRPGERVEVEGPFGEFLIAERDLSSRFLFVGTGTGVAPFHCFARSYPGLDYRLLHGVPAASELYGAGTFEAGRVTACLSRQPGPGFPGRVTEYLRRNPPDAQLYYLCGGADMIYDVFAMLRRQDIAAEKIFAEVYF